MQAISEHFHFFSRFLKMFGKTLRCRVDVITSIIKWIIIQCEDAESTLNQYNPCAANDSQKALEEEEGNIFIITCHNHPQLFGVRTAMA